MIFSNGCSPITILIYETDLKIKIIMNLFKSNVEVGLIGIDRLTFVCYLRRKPYKMS